MTLSESGHLLICQWYPFNGQDGKVVILFLVKLSHVKISVFCSQKNTKAKVSEGLFR